ncbi:MAG TPA: flagellar M-ring protein FliF [Myxococcaceae bacterium]|jgi:type III secretion protein J
MRHAAFVVLMFSACSEPIQHGLDERQANEIQSVLVERGLEAEKVVEPGKKPTWSIEVPKEQATDAVRILSELGLPRPRAEGFSDVFKESLVPSPTEERARYLAASSGELSRTLESVDGVVSARVHLVLPPPPRPGAVPVPAKASAFLKVRPGMVERVNHLKEDLRALVAGGVENLSPDQVTLVVSEVATTVPARPGPASSSSLPPLRVAVAGLGGTVTLLSLALVWLALRLRRERTRAVEPLRKPAPAPTAAPPARKVA